MGRAPSKTRRTCHWNYGAHASRTFGYMNRTRKVDDPFHEYPDTLTLTRTLTRSHTYPLTHTYTNTHTHTRRSHGLLTPNFGYIAKMRLERERQSKIAREKVGGQAKLLLQVRCGVWFQRGRSQNLLYGPNLVKISKFFMLGESVDLLGVLRGFQLIRNQFACLIREINRTHT